MGNDYPPIRNFTDACAEAWAMCERFKYFHAAFGLDAEGNVHDAVALTMRRRHTHDHAITWAMCSIRHNDRIKQVVLLSRAKDPNSIHERDLTWFERTRTEFAAIGVEFVDWIKVNREVVRSFALTLGIESWTDLGPLGASYIQSES